MTRPAALATTLLFLMMAAHAALESARDAFLLSALPPVALLWSYIIIAALAVVVTRLGRGRRPPGLPLLLAAGSFVALAFWLALPTILPSGTIALYVFTALYATVVVPRFWLLLTGWFTVGEAKRNYTWIGLGGIAGATVGSAASTWLLTFASARALLLFGSVTYLLAAGIAAASEKRAEPAHAAGPVTGQYDEQRSYVRRLVWTAALASATFTVVDYLFKANAAARIPESELAAYFARTYTGVNFAALVAQMFVAPILLRRLGTHAAALLLPLLLLMAAGSFAAMGWPVLALMAKGTDGTLRNSLHRTTSELLYFPLPAEARERWKGVADALGQRGGQALGALVLLGLAALGAGSRPVAALAAVLALAWMVVIASTREPYRALFRHGLRRGALPATIPVLASDTLQAILEAFSSPDDEVVCAAIELLAESGNERLVPSVLVHHPSQQVALRALHVLARSKRTDLAGIMRPLLEHANVTVRATALRICLEAEHDRGMLLAALHDPSAEVRVAALLALLKLKTERVSALAHIDAIALGHDNEAKLALARACQTAPWIELTAQLLRMIETPVVAVRREALRALAAVPHASYLTQLQPLLGDRRVLSDVRRLVVAASAGDSALVEGWLADRSLPPSIRLHLPRTLSAFGTERAAAALLRELAQESDERVRYKILRGLGRMRADRPALKLDTRALYRHAAANLERALELLAYRVALGDQTPGRIERLLRALLKNKEERALENVFRILGILQPQLGLEDIWRGVRAQDPRAHDAALEIVDTLSPVVRRRLVPVLRHASDEARLREAGVEPQSPHSAIDAMTRDVSAPIQQLAQALQESSDERA